jgi:hypothetical protein
VLPLVTPPSCLLVTPHSRPLVVLIVPSGCCVAPRCAVVLSSHHPLTTPNFSRGARDDGGRCPPPPRMSNVVVGVGLTITSLLPSSSPWMLFLALQPCCRSSRSCRRCQSLFHCPPPSSTLVAITITITLFVAIAIARAAAKLPPTSRSHAAATAADAAAAAAPPPSYVALSRCHAAATAAPPPSCRQPCPVALPPPPLLVGCCVVVRRPISSSHAVLVAGRFCR